MKSKSPFDISVLSQSSGYINECTGNLGRTWKRHQESKQVSLCPFPCLIILAGEMDAEQQLPCLQYWQRHLQSLTLHSVLIQLEEMPTCLPEAGMKVKLSGKEISISIIIIYALTTEKITEPGTTSKARACRAQHIAHAARAGHASPAIRRQELLKQARRWRPEVKGHFGKSDW